jgi:hypothetical protein
MSGPIADMPKPALLPSRPGELHPEPLTEPDLTLSRHPARAIARRLPPSIEHRAPPVAGWPAPMTMACSLRSTGITPLLSYYEAVRPSPAHRYFGLAGWSRLCLFPYHRRPGSHVPYESLVELRAAYTPDAARPVSGHPPSSSRETGHPPVSTSSNPISTLLQRFACARLSRPCLPGSSSRRFRNVHHRCF